MASHREEVAKKKAAYEEWKRQRDAQESTPAEPADEYVPDPDPEREEIRRRNREKYPELAAFVDEVRRVFPGAKVTKITPYTPEEMEARRRSLATRAPTATDETDDQQ